MHNIETTKLVTKTKINFAFWKEKCQFPSLHV